MKKYKRITIFQNTLRLMTLYEYRELIIKYFNNSRPTYNEGRNENDEAKNSRMKINLLSDEVYQIVNASEISSSVIWSPPPIIGGYIKNIDLINNIFYLDKYDLDPNTLLDIIDRSIGKYHRNKIPSIIRLFNPFFYISEIFIYIMELPFLFLAGFGFRREYLENSLIGKLTKLLVFLITLSASFLTVLDLLGYLDLFKATIKNISN